MVEMPGGCSATVTEPFALRVLGDSMLPEFEDGAIIIVDPGGPYEHGSYIVADHDDEPILRQLIYRDGRAYLQALNHGYPLLEANDPLTVRGVVVQKYHRRKRKHYL